MQNVMQRNVKLTEFASSQQIESRPRAFY